MDTWSTLSGVGRLEVGQPFDLAKSVHSGQSHRWRRDGAGAGWHWGVAYDNLVKIKAGPRSTSGAICLEFSAAGGNVEELVPRIQSFFRLDDDIESVYAEISRDPRVAEMVGLFPGLRLLRVDPWECMISFICSANSNLQRIHANVESIAETYGRRLVLDGHVRYTLPAPVELAEVGEQRLRDLGLGFRAPYVASAAVAVAGGALDLEALRRMAYSEAHERLMELPGIGPKIADCILLHSLDQLEAFPVDVWVRRALRDWYFEGGKPPPDREMAAWARDRFGRWAGYAELYLFHGRRLRGRQGSG